jgi:hypothetical protein
VGGKDVSVELVRAGLACHYTQYSSDLLLANSESQARSEGHGFWARNVAKPRCTKTPSPSAGDRRGLASTAETTYHGNTSSHAYHAPSCRNYNCLNCSRTFRSEAEAQAAGFRPAGDCLRR